MNQKLVVIDGHPEVESLGHAAAQAVQKAAEAQGLEVKFLRAYDFPFLDKDPARNQFPEAFNAAVKDIEEAQYLAFLSPMWNLSMTGGLKNFIDGVMQPKHLFEYTAKGPRGLLKTEKALIIWTSGGPTWAYKIFFGNPVFRQIKNVFKFCGVKKFSEISLGGIHGKGAPEEQKRIDAFLAQISNYKF